MDIRNEKHRYSWGIEQWRSHLGEGADSPCGNACARPVLGWRFNGKARAFLIDVCMDKPGDFVYSLSLPGFLPGVDGTGRGSTGLPAFFYIQSLQPRIKSFNPVSRRIGGICDSPERAFRPRGEDLLRGCAHTFLREENMRPRQNVTEMMRENKTILVVIAIVLFLVELEIFAVAAMGSGRKSRLHVYDQSGNLIHETDGKNLSEFNKYYFEKTFGPLEQYEVKLSTREKPFPFRSWFAAAVGIPVGVVLLFAFVMKAYLAIFYKEDPDGDKAARGDEYAAHETALGKTLSMVSRFNIFVIGFLIFMAVFLYFVIPDILKYLGVLGVETITRYKWFFLGTGGIALGLVVWVIYLRYLLARKAMDTRVELEKCKMQLEYANGNNQAPQLTYEEDKPLITLVPEEPGETGGEDAAMPGKDGSRGNREAADNRS